jgi:ATPase subunit of ABC transporter with duplicated ATPase domains
MAANDEPNVIISMIRVTKKNERKEILRDITLTFFYGAKIGVLGPNGSGKTTLMRILAGRDTEYDGQIALKPGYRTALLEQEPRLAPGRTVRATIEEGVRPHTDLLAAYDATWDEINDAPDTATRDTARAAGGAAPGHR